MRSKSRAKRSNTEPQPLIGDFINTIDPSQTSGREICCDAQQAPAPNVIASACLEVSAEGKLP
jgi:hypothetical protein